jgi:hypothetical protein
MSAEQFRELAILKEMKSCRHFNGVQHDTCLAGVNYDSVRPLPCIPLGSIKEPAKCEKKSCWTRGEAEKNETETEVRLQEGLTAIHAAHADAKAKGLKKGNGGKDSLPCPVCKTGTLHYSVADYNGHLWGQCDTKDCVSWME